MDPIFTPLPYPVYVPKPWDYDMINYPLQTYNFVYRKYNCIIERSPSLNWNGYVILPKYHPFYKKSFEDIKDKILVHGGLTFSYNGKFGFDTSHITDIIPLESSDRIKLISQFIGNMPRRYWTYNNVIDEIKRMVDQFIDYENYYFIN